MTQEQDYPRLKTEQELEQDRERERQRTPFESALAASVACAGKAEERYDAQEAQAWAQAALTLAHTAQVLRSL